MEEVTTELERAQLQKLLAFRDLCLVLIRKWSWLLFLSFVLLFALFTAYVFDRLSNSVKRYTATTKLLYSPRTVTKVHPPEDRQLHGILDRVSLKRRVSKTVKMSVLEEMCLGSDLSVRQERRPTNLYTLTASGSSRELAIEKVNTYAEVLIDEYVAYRYHELMKWTDTLEQRKNKLREQIAAMDSEETIEKSRTGVFSPVDELANLNRLISDQRNNLASLNVQYVNDEVKKKRLEKAVGKMGEAIIRCAPLIRKKSEQLAEMDKELAKLREMYTDLNPRVLGKLDDRRKLMEEYAVMLKENGIDGITVEEVEALEYSAQALADVTLHMEVLGENVRSLESQLKSNEEKSAVLTQSIPVLERIRVKRDELEKALRTLDEQQGDIEYIMMAAKNDIHQIEPAAGASDRSPLNLKYLAVVLLGAVVCTFAIAVVLLFIELIWGHVRGAAELSIYDGFHILGSLPKPNVLDEEIEQDVMGVVALNFSNTELPKSIVLVCTMLGVDNTEPFFEKMKLSLAMGGKTCFFLEVVPSFDFRPPEGDIQEMITVLRQGEHGWFPVENRYMLSPPEMQMFHKDLEKLHKEFDHVFIMMPEDLRQSGKFLWQLLELCESTLTMISYSSTPRAELKFLRRHVDEASKAMMFVVTDVPKGVVRKEMELDEV
ncbi:MAG: hypothetical protein IJJ26_07660 [Victivallales bacterium]|nr:hypothetical protein [Victivallales bacterium]